MYHGNFSLQKLCPVAQIDFVVSFFILGISRHCVRESNEFHERKITQEMVAGILGKIVLYEKQHNREMTMARFPVTVVVGPMKELGFLQEGVTLVTY